MIKKALFSILVLFVGCSVLTPVYVSAQQFDPLDSACDTEPNATVCKENAANQGSDPINGNNGLITRAVNIISVIAGIAAVFVIILSGITMIMSQGESAKVKQARDTIIFAAVGLAVIALSRSIIIFVINKI